MSISDLDKDSTTKLLIKISKILVIICVLVVVYITLVGLSPTSVEWNGSNYLLTEGFACDEKTDDTIKLSCVLGGHTIEGKKVKAKDSTYNELINKESSSGSDVEVGISGFIMPEAYNTTHTMVGMWDYGYIFIIPNDAINLTHDESGAVNPDSLKLKSDNVTIYEFTSNDIRLADSIIRSGYNVEG